MLTVDDAAFNRLQVVNWSAVSIGHLRAPLVLVWWWAACAFNPDGQGSASGANVGEGGASSEGGVSTSPATGESTSTPTSTTAGTGTEATDATAGVDSASESSGGAKAELEIAGGELVDFGAIQNGESEERVIQVVNLGGGPATGLTSTALEKTFVFAGGQYPGTSGDCGDSLAAGAACGINIAYTPGEWGPSAAELTLTYDDGVDGKATAIASLRGVGVGTSGQLLVNGDAEMGGTPPIGWSIPPRGGGSWTSTGDQSPPSGVLVIHAGWGPELFDFALAQTVDASHWASAIDSEGVTIHLSAWVRAMGANNDYGSVRLQFLGEDGSSLGTMDSPTYSDGPWQESQLDGKTPMGTRSVSVVLLCHKDVGNSCDAYFDELSLTAAYP